MAGVSLALILTTALPMTSWAVAETGAPVLQLPFGVRGNAMGLSGVADRSDPANITFNPANVTAVDGLWMTGSREALVPGLASDVWLGHLNIGGGHALGDNNPILLAFNLLLARLSYGRSIATNPGGTPLGTYESHEDVFGVTVGAEGALGERAHWAFGVGAKRLSLDYAPAEFTIENEKVQASRWMVDVGAMVSTVVDASDWRVRPALGLAAVNVGSDIEFEGRDDKDPLPSWFNYGVSVRVDAPDVTLGPNRIPALSAALNLDGNHGLNDQRPHWAFGYELSLLHIISARWGRRTDDVLHTPIETWGVALGAPLGPVRARFEYANVVGLYVYPRDVYGFTVVWLLGDRSE